VLAGELHERRRNRQDPGRRGDRDVEAVIALISTMALRLEADQRLARW